MKRIYLFIISLFVSLFTFSQNVGVGTTTPTNALHVVPNSNNDPLRIEGLKLYSSERHLLIMDTATGIVKDIPVDSLIALIKDSIDTDIDSISFINDTLYLHEDNQSLKVYIPNVADTDIDSASYVNDTLYLHEDNQSLKVYIPSGTDTDIDSASYVNDTLYLHEDNQSLKVYIPSGADTDIDSASYVNDTLYLHEDNQSLKVYIPSGVDTDVDSLNFVNDTLYLYENSKIIKTDIPSSSGSLAGYDTVEYLTGKVWIDGKPVYERVIHNYTGPTPTIDLSSYFSPNYIQTVLEFRIIYDCSSLPNNSVHHSSYGSFAYTVGNNRIQTYSNSNFSLCGGGGSFTFIMEYTKQ